MRLLTARRGAMAGTAIIAAVLVLASVLPAGASMVDTEVALAGQQVDTPPVDPYAQYEPQDECDPTPKPGVVAFAELLLEAYPVSGSSGISRECGVRGPSEHKEGRAFDWAVSTANPAQNAAADEALATLLATDAEGNRHALFRRFGLMYMIWDGQIFSAIRADEGWRPYPCNPYASYDSCHTRHVHFSFSTDGAQMRTSWWSMQPEPSSSTPAVIEQVTDTGGIATAIEISTATFPTVGSTEQVFLANANEPHDVIIASVLAGASHSAVLLTDGPEREDDPAAGEAAENGAAAAAAAAAATHAPLELEPNVDAELTRLLGDGGRVTLVGETDTLPDSLLGDRDDTYMVRRIAGDNPVATARVAALEMERVGESRTAVLAGVDALDEALPMIAVAAANDWPVLFTAVDTLSVDAEGLLRSSSIEHVHIAGSTAAVSNRVRRAVRDLDIGTTRHAGDTPYQTSAAVAEHFFAIPSAYALVNADDTASAAVAAAYAGERRHAPLLLTDGSKLSQAVTRYIRRTTSPETAGILFGDADTMRPQVERDLRRALR